MIMTIMMKVMEDEYDDDDYNDHDGVKEKMARTTLTPKKGGGVPNGGC